MKQILIPLAATALFIVIIGLFINNSKSEKSIVKNIVYEKTEITISDKKITADIADNETKRNKGLSVKKTLAENSGMLFVFDSQNTQPNFWMKDMKFPIDIIWINDGKIVQIDKDIQPETKKKDSEYTLYWPNEVVDYVLEVQAGYCDKNNIKVGDSVSFNLGS